MATNDLNKYIEVNKHSITCHSPTPEREVFPFVTYPRKKLAALGDKFIKSVKNMAKEHVISPTFAEVIILAVKAA
jgi:hypothetical protein